MAPAKLNNIKLILFDAFDTLLRPTAPPYQQYADVARRYGLKVKDDDVKASFRQAFKDMSRKHPNYGRNTELPYPDIWWSLVIGQTFQSLSAADVSREKPSNEHVKGAQKSRHERLLTLQQKLDLEDYDDQLWQVLPRITAELIERFGGKEAYELFADVKPTFLQLQKRGIRTNIVSNSDDKALLALTELELGDCMRGDLHWSGLTATEEQERAKLGRHYKSGGCTMSYFEGMEKPDGRIFEAALMRNGIALSEEGRKSVIYVGDQIEEDFWGARAAGLHALWLSRGGESNQPTKGDSMERSGEDLELLKAHTIESLSEVIKRLENDSGEEECGVE